MSRLAAALRRRHRGAFAVLAVVVAVGALLICALAAQAVAVVRSGGVGDLTSVAMFVVIAGLLTAVLLRSCVDHLVTTRWGEYMRLRILGATRAQITSMMVGDLRGVTLLGALLGAAGATLVWTPVSETLHGLDVVDEVHPLGLVTALTATAVTVLLVCACALAGVASAAWAVCRPEPALRRRDPGARPP
ncbi:FtsX-like permease family protein, partial [Cellulomonas triticagri]